MEARNANGSWAGQDAGWTEGDMWAYTFDVIQDIPGLIERRGGNASFVAFLDEHFDGGQWNVDLSLRSLTSLHSVPFHGYLQDTMIRRTRQIHTIYLVLVDRVF